VAPLSVASKNEHRATQTTRAAAKNTWDAERRSELLERIDHFIAMTGMSAAAVGTNALGDSSFVYALRGGRDPRLSSYGRVWSWLDANWPRADADGGSR
jgi:hypothetical protein